MDEIILVDEKDNQIGVGEKLLVHKEGKLHRCFSIFVFDKEGSLMLQKGLLENIIAADYGLIPVAVIQGREKK